MLAWGIILLRPTDEMAYSLLAFYIIIPVAGCVCSLMLGLKGNFLKWIMPIVCTIVNGYAPGIVFHSGIAVTMAIVASTVSVAGLAVGCIIAKQKQ